MQLLRLAFVLGLAAVPAVAQYVLSHSTVNKSVNAVLAVPLCQPVASTVPGVPGSPADNHYWRSYDLAALGFTTPIEISGVAFWGRWVNTPAATPTVIQAIIYADPLPPDPAPRSQLQNLRGEQFTVFSSPMPVHVRHDFAAPIIVQPTATIVVEIFVPGTSVGFNGFRIGGNALGESGSSYFSAPSCQQPEPVAISTLGYPGSASPSPVHLVIDLVYRPVTVPLPGTGEDFTLTTGINGPPLLPGIGSLTHVVTNTDTITFELWSPIGSFDLAPLIVVAELSPLLGPLPAAFYPGIQVGAGAQIIVGTPGSLAAPPLLPAAGFRLSSAVPAALSGTRAVLQGIVLSGAAANGFFASTDAHEILIL
jgi:hypothetical protein